MVGDAVVVGAAIIALPSVVLMMIFGQTRILFTMSRDGLLPEVLSRVHPRFHTPHVVTWITGIAVSLFAAMFPVDMLADISNAGTLFAFFMVAMGVMILRRTEPDRPRPFRTPLVWIVGPLAMAGCVLLFFSLGWNPTIKFFCVWAVHRPGRVLPLRAPAQPPGAGQREPAARHRAAALPGSAGARRPRSRAVIATANHRNPASAGFSVSGLHVVRRGRFDKLPG